MDNRGVDTSIGAVNRRFEKIERSIEDMRSARRGGATTIDRGDLTITAGGNVIVDGGGGLSVNSGGDIAVNSGGDLSINSGGNVWVVGGGKVSVIGTDSIATMEGGRFGIKATLPDGSLTFPSTQAVPAGFLCDAGPGKGFAVFRVDEPTGKAVVTSSVGAVMLPYTTTSDAANTRILFDGTIQMVTSSRRYKADERPAVVDPAAVLSLVGKTWCDKNDAGTPDEGKRYVGFIAEDVHDAGLTDFVDYDAKGRPDAIQYDRLSVALLALAKVDHARIDDLAAQLKVERARVDALEARMTALEARLPAPTPAAKK